MYSIVENRKETVINVFKRVGEDQCGDCIRKQRERDVLNRMIDREIF